MEIRIERVYDDASSSDGFRVLVDRLGPRARRLRRTRQRRMEWPRGLSKERAALDLWAEEVAPSTELRKTFPHDGMSFDAFAAAYRAEELAENPAVP